MGFLYAGNSKVWLLFFSLFAQLKDVSGLAQKHVGDAKTHLGLRSFTFGACDYADFRHVMDTSFTFFLLSFSKSFLE